MSHRRRWAVWSWEVVGSKANPMIDRLKLIKTPWGGVYLHFIRRPDADEHPHDHPWSMFSVVLRGGYSERVWLLPFMPRVAEERWYGVGAIHRMSTHVAHMITEVEPGTVTLAFVSGRQCAWGFWSTKGTWPTEAKWIAPVDYEAGAR